MIVQRLMNGISIIHWETGKPKEEGWYLVTFRNGQVHNVYFKTNANCAYWKYANEGNIIAWCKLTDIEPYKEEKE